MSSDLSVEKQKIVDGLNYLFTRTIGIAASFPEDNYVIDQSVVSSPTFHARLPSPDFDGYRAHLCPVDGSNFPDTVSTILDSMLTALEATGRVTVGPWRYAQIITQAFWSSAAAANDGKLTYGDAGKIVGGTVGGALFVGGVSRVALMVELLSPGSIEIILGSIVGLEGGAGLLAGAALLFTLGFLANLAIQAGEQAGIPWFEELGKSLEKFVRDEVPKDFTNWLKNNNLLRPVVIDPLVIDLNGNGFNLISADASSVSIDMDSDGYAERIGWMRGSEGLLVIDRNSDGLIEAPDDLFGSATQDGFDALRLIDSNSDSIISSADSQFASLRIWQDLNEDGIAQTVEVKTLAEMGIVNINLSTTTVNQQSAGNTIANVSNVLMADGSTRFC